MELELILIYQRIKIFIIFVFSAVEAVHLANLLCQFGYYFPVSEQKNLLVKDDSSLYRFQVTERKIPASYRLALLSVDNFLLLSYWVAVHGKYLSLNFCQSKHMCEVCRAQFFAASLMSSQVFLKNLQLRKM